MTGASKANLPATVNDRRQSNAGRQSTAGRQSAMLPSNRTSMMAARLAASKYTMRPKLTLKPSWYHDSLEDKCMAAKRQLMLPDSKGVSVYEHLNQVILSCLNDTKPGTAKTKTALDFREISAKLKVKTHLTPKLPRHFLPINESATSLRPLQASLDLFKARSPQQAGDKGDDKPLGRKPSDEFGGLLFSLDDGEDAGLPEVEPFPDVMQTAYLLEQGGFGVSRTEFYLVALALNQLRRDQPLDSARFWGKIIGLRGNYIIAECKLSEDEIAKETAQFEADNKTATSSKQEEEEVSEYLSENTDVDPFSRPLPLADSGKKKFDASAEAPATGCNLFAYFVCAEPGAEWTRLPNVTPSQIAKARRMRKLFTGDLDQDLVCLPRFPGKEREYLRAQIARISACIQISPKGYFSVKKEDEDDKHEIGAVVRDTSWDPLEIPNLADKLMKGWVHHRSFILGQGGCEWQNPLAKTESQIERELEMNSFDMLEQENDLSIEKETGPALLSPCSDDDPLDGTEEAWSVVLSANRIPSQKVIQLRSNVWPGGCTVASLSNPAEPLFDSAYVGWGLKYNSRNFNPPEPMLPQEEHPGDGHTIEEKDPTLEMEQAYQNKLKQLAEQERRARMGLGPEDSSDNLGEQESLESLEPGQSGFSRQTSAVTDAERNA